VRKCAVLARLERLIRRRPFHDRGPCAVVRAACLADDLPPYRDVGSHARQRDVTEKSFRQYEAPLEVFKDIVEIAHAVEAINGRIHIEMIRRRAPVSVQGGSGLVQSCSRMNESGTYVIFAEAGAQLFA
jgi:hypothetical protein